MHSSSLDKKRGSLPAAATLKVSPSEVQTLASGQGSVSWLPDPTGMWVSCSHSRGRCASYSTWPSSLFSMPDTVFEGAALGGKDATHTHTHFWAPQCALKCVFCVTLLNLYFGGYTLSSRLVGPPWVCFWYSPKPSQAQVKWAISENANELNIAQLGWYVFGSKKN